MLSRRAQEQVPSSASNEMWDVMKEPWDRHKNTEGFVNLGVAENRLMQRELQGFLTEHWSAQDSMLTYQDGPLGSQRVRQALARFLGRELKTYRPLSASQIIVTNGVPSALEHAAWALADPGEAFLLGRPYYGSITLHLRPKVQTVPVTFDQVDPIGLAAVDCYEQALLGARAQGIVVRGPFLCSPHNPLGRCYPRHVLVALVALCDKYQMHVLSDEIYALSVWRVPAFTSVLSLPLENLIDPALVHVLWGVSKDFGANGWRLGCPISPANEDLRTAVASVAIGSYASSLTDHVVAQMLEDDAFTASYLAENQRRLANAYAWTTDFLQRHDVLFMSCTHAALFVWADLGTAYRRRHPQSAAGRQEAVDDIKRALLEHKVYLAWGGNFDSESPDLFRLAFAHPAGYVDEGLRRIDQALNSGSIQGPRRQTPPLISNTPTMPHTKGSLHGPSV